MKLHVQHDTNEYPVHIEIRYDCDNCEDKGYIVTGFFDDITDARCPFCNPKMSTADMMDDNSDD